MLVLKSPLPLKMLDTPSLNWSVPSAVIPWVTNSAVRLSTILSLSLSDCSWRRVAIASKTLPIDSPYLVGLSRATCSDAVRASPLIFLAYAARAASSTCRDIPSIAGLVVSASPNPETILPAVSAASPPIPNAVPSAPVLSKKAALSVGACSYTSSACCCWANLAS